MKKLQISDITLALCASGEISPLTFRKKTEIAKLLDAAGVSVIELGTVSGNIADNLLVKSVASAVKNSKIALCPGFDEAAIAASWEALKEAKSPRLQVIAAVSTARMEYVYHKKADAMLQTVAEAIKACRTHCEDVEFVAEDATRADFDYLCRVLQAAIDAGAKSVTVCDTAGAMLPSEFGTFLKELYAGVPQLREICLGVRCSAAMDTANSAAIEAILAGAGTVKVSAIRADSVSLSSMAKILSSKAETLGVESSLQFTQINRILEEIDGLCNQEDAKRSPFEDGVRQYPENMAFTADDQIADVMKGAVLLGYDLNETDEMRVWNAFRKIVSRKQRVTINELDAIIASEAMQVPDTYTLENYVVTTGNAIGILAHIKLRKGSDTYDGLSLGDGPIDAAFLAIEQITGHHYELDDFQIQSITEGREAVGQTIVKLRSNGKVYPGRGLSTDIIGAGVAAYINALNKILYEEETL